MSQSQRSLHFQGNPHSVWKEHPQPVSAQRVEEYTKFHESVDTASRLSFQQQRFIVRATQPAVLSTEADERLRI